MSDYPVKPWDPAAEPTRPDEEEGPKRPVPEDELKDVLKEHEKWLKSVEDESDEALEQRLRKFMEESTWDKRPGANFQSKKLPGEKFKETDLRWANFRRAGLQNADFRLADLRGTLFFDADLRKADLRDADLARADLKDAKLNEAKLFRATLREANLQDADLTDVKGLLAEQLGGANVSGATLPDDIAEFKGLDHVTEISKNARKIFLSMLLGCAYSWLTIATTADARLLTNSASSPLPIIGTEIPIAWFYWAAPIILGALYVYLHLYLQRLWESLAGLPARLQDGNRLDEHAYPWLLNGLVRRHFKLLKEGRPPIARVEEWVTVFLAWWVVPGTLFGFWLRYLPRHDWGGTWLHIGLTVATILAAAVFYSSAARTLRGDQRQPFRWKTSWRDRRSYQTVGVVIVGFMLWGLSDGAINGVRSLDYTQRHSLMDPPDLENTDPRRLVPRAFSLIGYSPFADLREADLSTKSENWRGTEMDVALVTGANLKGSDLWYADAVRAFLVKANLRDANLQRADFHYANLQGAVLTDARIQKADFGRANLRDADFTRAKLQGARLFGAKLHGATLDHADLTKADLRGTDFSGANLGDTWGLTQDQLDEACGNAKTQLPPGMSIPPCPKTSK